MYFWLIIVWTVGRSCVDAIEWSCWHWLFLWCIFINRIDTSILKSCLLFSHSCQWSGYKSSVLSFWTVVIVLSAKGHSSDSNPTTPGQQFYQKAISITLWLWYFVFKRRKSVQDVSRSVVNISLPVQINCSWVR